MPLPESTERRHDQAVQEIARLRFAFPNEEHPDFKTYLNIPEPTMAVPNKEGDPICPDIVVTSTSRNVLQMTAVVESIGTVAEEKARSLWLPCSQLPVPFSLYVPLESVAEAKRVLKKLKIKVSGLRSWRYLVGFKTIEVANIYDRLSPLAMLLPRALIPHRLLET